MAKIWVPPFLEIFYKGIGLFFHRGLAASREPYAGIEGSILHLRMRVRPSSEASQNFWSGAFEFHGGGGGKLAYISPGDAPQGKRKKI